ncbi:MAG: hypothetical protein ACREUY_06480 [Burkholderiales bacterium]
MNKLFFSLVAVMITTTSYDVRGDAPAHPAATNPAGQGPMVEMPLKRDEPMPTGMKKEAMKQEDVKKEYMKKEPMIEELMEKEEIKK